jgi:hypothetical protein
LWDAVTNGNRIGWDLLDAVRRLTASYGIIVIIRLRDPCKKPLAVL